MVAQFYFGADNL